MGRAITRRSAIDLDRVRAAVEAAERRTSAELVVSIAPFFVGSVWSAAQRAFARLGVAQTSHRNGVLVFLVPARRQVVVLADAGALAQVEPSLWPETASRMAAACGRGDGTGGLIEGIERLADALSAPFPSGPGDVNELPDQPRTGDAS